MLDIAESSGDNFPLATTHSRILRSTLRHLTWLLLIGLITACGSSTPTILSGVVAEEEETLPAGTSKSYPFTVNIANQIEPALIASLGTLDANREVTALVLTETNYALWESAEPYNAQFESPISGSDISVLIDISDAYRLVISNRSGTSPVTYQIAATLFWQAP